jgi:hypothetical protein
MTRGAMVPEDSRAADALGGRYGRTVCHPVFIGLSVRRLLRACTLSSLAWRDVRSAGNDGKPFPICPVMAFSGLPREGSTWETV